MNEEYILPNGVYSLTKQYGAVSRKATTRRHVQLSTNIYDAKNLLFQPRMEGA
jgi:hypothetical protein